MSLGRRRTPAAKRLDPMPEDTAYVLHSLWD
jgi:hypothetical protein